MQPSIFLSTTFVRLSTTFVLEGIYLPCILQGDPGSHTGAGMAEFMARWLTVTVCALTE